MIHHHRQRDGTPLLVLGLDPVSVYVLPHHEDPVTVQLQLDGPIAARSEIHFIRSYARIGGTGAQAAEPPRPLRRAVFVRSH